MGFEHTKPPSMDELPRRLLFHGVKIAGHLAPRKSWPREIDDGDLHHRNIIHLHLGRCEEIFELFSLRLELRNQNVFEIHSTRTFMAAVELLSKIDSRVRQASL